MNRQEKEQVITTLRENFKNNQASFLVGYKGMTVAQVAQLRKQLRSKGGSFQVAKVSLIKRVVHELSDVEGLTPYLKNQVALVFADQESPAIAKVLFDFADNNQQLNIVAGYLESKILTPDAVKILASLPSKEILLAQVCGAAKAPVVAVTHVLSLLLLRFIFVVKQLEEQKKSS